MAVMEMLLQAGADPKSRTQQGHTAGDLYQQAQLYHNLKQEQAWSDPAPSEVHDEFWLWYREPHIPDTCAAEPGKWMVYYPKGKALDQAWVVAKGAYKAGRLTGVKAIKVSTSAHNSRPVPKHNDFSLPTVDPSIGVLKFYCGPASDETKMKLYGENIMRCMADAESGRVPEALHVVYKSDESRVIQMNKSSKSLPGATARHTYILQPERSALWKQPTHSGVPAVGPGSHALETPIHQGSRPLPSPLPRLESHHDRASALFAEFKPHARPVAPRFLRG